MYAVVALQGHQYLVKSGDSIVVDNMQQEVGDSVTLDTVLLCFDESGNVVKVGQPSVEDAVVKATVTEHRAGEKISVMKFQSKKRYKRTKGFRPQETILSIDSVEVHVK